MIRRAVLIATLIVVGCSSSQETREAVVPPQETSVHVGVPDTTLSEWAPPARLEGRPTRPYTVDRYQGTGAPGVIERVEITDDSVTVQSREEGQSVRRTYDGPPEGETLVAQGDTAQGDTTVQAAVEGRSKADTTTVLAKEDDEPGFFDRVRNNLAILGGLLLLSLAGGAAAKVFDIGLPI